MSGVSVLMARANGLLSNGGRMVLRANTPVEQFTKHTAKLCGITEDLVEPAPKE